MLAALLLIPLLGHPAHLPRLRPRPRDRRRARPRLALRRRTGRPRLRGLAAGRDDQGRRHGPRPLRGRDRPRVRAGGRTRPTATRVLELNEGQAVHSLVPPGQLPDRRLLGRPPRPALRGPVAAAAADRDPRQRVPGTVARAYGHFFPETAVDAVEIDAELSELGRRFFDLRNPRMRVFAEDARPWLRRAPRRLRRDHASTPTASPTSPSTWRRGSSSSWPGTGSRPAAS